MRPRTATIKLENWVKENPNGYLKKSMRQIAKELEISRTTVSIELYRIIAKRDNCLPSDVKEKLIQNETTRDNHKLSKKEKHQIEEMQNENIPEIDIAYYIGRSIESTKKYIRSLENKKYQQRS